jgi:hypothetical protein
MVRGPALPAMEQEICIGLDADSYFFHPRGIFLDVSSCLVAFGPEKNVFINSHLFRRIE